MGETGREGDWEMRRRGERRGCPTAAAVTVKLVIRLGNREKEIERMCQSHAFGRILSRRDVSGTDLKVLLSKFDPERVE